MLNTIILDLLSLTILTFSLLVIVSQNPVISIIYLISVFLFSACYLILINITFIGLSYLIVYIGAVAILFLFVIIILSISIDQINTLNTEFTKNLPLGFFLAIVLFLEIMSFLPILNLSNFFLNLFNHLNNLFLLQKTYILETIQNSLNLLFNPFNSDITFKNYSQIETLGFELYIRSSVELILTSLILLLAILAPILLCIDKKKA